MCKLIFILAMSFIGFSVTAQQKVKFSKDSKATIEIPTSFKFSKSDENLVEYSSMTSPVNKIYLSYSGGDFVIPTISYLLESNRKIYNYIHNDHELMEWDERQLISGDDRKVQVQATEYMFFPKSSSIKPFNEYNIDLYVENSWYTISLQYPINVSQSSITPIARQILDSFLATGIISENKVKMDYESGVFKIPATINGVVKSKFIFDTGASSVCISPSLFNELYLTGTLSETDYIKTATFINANGVESRSKVYLLKSLTVGGRTVYEVECAVSNTNIADMLLGQSFLEKLGSFQIDYNNSYLIFK